MTIASPSAPSHALEVSRRNVGTTERWISIAVGLTAVFVARRGLGPVAWATRAIGSALLARGASGRSELYRMLRVDTAHERSAFPLRRSITLDAAPNAILDHLAEPEHLIALVPRVTSATAIEVDRWRVSARGFDGASLEIDLDVVREPDAIRWNAPQAPQRFEVVASVAPGDGGQALSLCVRVAPSDGAARGLAPSLRKRMTLELGRILRRVKARLEGGAAPDAASRARARRVRSKRSVRRTAGEARRHPP